MCSCFFSRFEYIVLFSVLENKGKQKSKMKGLKKKEEKEKKSVKTTGEDPKDNMADNDDSSSTTTETSNPDVETNLKEVRRHVRLQSNVINSVFTLFTSNMPLTSQEPVKKKGRVATSGKEKEEILNFQSKPKEKRAEASKKEIQAEKSRFVC